MIKSIIFDCFGVLTEDGWLAFLHKYSTDENSEQLRYLNHQADMGLIKYESFLEQICEITGAEKAEAHETITKTHHPNLPLFEYIKELKKDGYILGVISNAGSELTDYLADQYVDIFDVITLSYQVNAVKPQPKIYLAHLSKLGLKPEETVFIDDRDYNCEGARAVGMKSILYSDLEVLKRDLEQYLR